MIRRAARASTGRRSFIKGTAGVIAGAAAATMLPGRREASAAAAPVLLGAWQPDDMWTEIASRFTGVAALELDIGRRLDVLHWYHGWEAGRLPGASVFRAVASHGSLPLVTWSPGDEARGVNQPRYALARITRGDFDAFIDESARAAKATGVPIYLRFAHEMDGPYYPWSVGQNGNTSTDFIEAWRRVVRRFRAAGADNVRWVW